MKRLTFAVSFAMALLTAVSLQADTKITLELDPGEFDRTNTPVRVEVEAPDSAKSVTIQDAAGNQITGQLTSPVLLSKSKKKNIEFVVPKLEKGKKATFTATLSDKPASGAAFAFKTEEGKTQTLEFDGRPILRYMHEALDDSRREETYKVFHHVFDTDGSRTVTKGAGGKYTHHRGLFFGFNRITYGENKGKADIWHAKGDAFQSHEGFVSNETGPVVGRHRMTIDWHGEKQEVFARETRELSVYHVPGGHLIEFATRLESKSGPITVDGDPQHAGFHFRADNEVASKTSGKTIYLRPDGQDKPGATRNWPGNKDHVNLIWNSMSFVLGEQRYTACYIDRPENPKEARFSERNYGRFGSYFKYEFDESSPLELNYRVWFQRDEVTGEQVQKISDDFVNPVKVSVK